MLPHHVLWKLRDWTNPWFQEGRGGGDKDGDEGGRPVRGAPAGYGNTESLYYTPETDVTLSVSYAGIKIIIIKKKQE